MLAAKMPMRMPGVAHGLLTDERCLAVSEFVQSCPPKACLAQWFGEPVGELVGMCGRAVFSGEHEVVIDVGVPQSAAHRDQLNGEGTSNSER